MVPFEVSLGVDLSIPAPPAPALTAEVVAYELENGDREVSAASEMSLLSQLSAAE